jgi:tetratricopeptide (TPR) repeat protein
MKREDDNRLEDQFESWVSAYHEALADGSAATPPQEVPPPELLPRVQRAQACLQFLERVWPRSQPAPPVDLPESLPAAVPSPPGPPTQVGRFHILRELGRGGFGIVFLAEDPTLGRQVALKVPRGQTLLDADLRKRFVWEAETAAKLSHAHIVPVLEAGEAGAILYIATEYCPGTTLAEWLEQRKQPAPPRSAALLMATLAEAVHYIHSRGILHRDLKPRNILLTTPAEGSSSGPSDARQDLERFLPKLTDFGLAKVLEREGGDTKSGTAVGTPRYMAPEQVRGRLKEIGWHTDVYALGVILYELLTGRPPFHGDSDQDTGEQILSREPVPPSRLVVKVPRDLETICLKCLQKEPAKRYGSTRDLAEDLRRFLNGEPIRARPVSQAERLVRWCLRNPLVASLLAVVIALLVAAAVGSTFAVLRIAAARDEAEKAHAVASEKALAEAAAKEHAEKSFQHALDTVDQYLTQVSESEELRTHGLEGLRRELVRTAGQFYRQFIQERGEEPRLRDQWAHAYFRLAMITGDIDTASEAINLLQKAVVLHNQLVDEYPFVEGYQSRLAQIHRNLGNLYRTTNRLKEAETAYRSGLQINEKLVQDHPTVPDYRHTQARLLSNLSGLYAITQRSAQADATLRQCRDILAKLVQDHPRLTSYQQDLATVHNNLASRFRWRQPKEALEAYRQALKIQEKLVEEHPKNPGFQNDLARTHYNLGNYWYQNGQDRNQAETAYRQGLDNWEKLARKHPLVHAYQHALAQCLGSLAMVYNDSKRPDKAEAAYRQAMTIQEGLVRDHPTVGEYALAFAVTAANLGDLESEPSAKLEWYTQAIRKFEGIFAGNKQHALAKEFLRGTYDRRAQVLVKVGRHAEAILDWDRAIQLAVGKERDEFHLARAVAQARTGDHRQASAEANELAGKAPGSGNVLYQAACVYALSSVAVPKDAELRQIERDKLAARYGSRAVALLTQAEKAGYFKAPAEFDQLRKDTDLDPLRSRPDFQKLLREMAETAKAAGK